MFHGWTDSMIVLAWLTSPSCKVPLTNLQMVLVAMCLRVSLKTINFGEKANCFSKSVTENGRRQKSSIRHVKNLVNNVHQVHSFDYTDQAFIAAYRRFVEQRGRCTVIVVRRLLVRIPNCVQCLTSSCTN